MKKIRIITQISFFVLFAGTFLFINTNPLAYRAESEFFLYLNPFSGFLVSLASKSLIFPISIVAMVMILLTVLFGRFFCGYICPLGATVDFLDKYLFAKMRSAARRVPAYMLRRLKYVILIISVVLAIFGAFYRC